MVGAQHCGQRASDSLDAPCATGRTREAETSWLAALALATARNDYCSCRCTCAAASAGRSALCTRGGQISARCWRSPPYHSRRRRAARGRHTVPRMGAGRCRVGCRASAAVGVADAHCLCCQSPRCSRCCLSNLSRQPQCAHAPAQYRLVEYIPYGACRRRAAACHACVA